VRSSIFASSLFLYTFVVMKKYIFILALFVIPLLGFAQYNNNVKVDNKKLKEKEGPLNNKAIKKSRKQMNKQGDKFDESKYNVPVRGKGKEDKDKQQNKQPAKKADTKGKM
jgi:hypothetical protein